MNDLKGQLDDALVLFEISERGLEGTLERVERRRRRRRVRGQTLSTLVVVLAVVGVLTLIFHGHGTNSRQATAGSPGSGVHVSALRFLGSFVPQQIVAQGGHLWVLGSTDPQSYEDCAIEEVDPTTLSTMRYGIPACAVDIAAGAGHIYLTTSTFVPDTAATQDVRIEVFDTNTHRSIVLPAIDMSLVGSAIAHTALAYGDGSLWLYGHGSEIVKISPSTGAVLATMNDAPGIGGHFPTVVANTTGLWAAGGPGGPPDLELFRHGSPVSPQSYEVSSQSSIVWLATIDNRVWADVLTYVGHGASMTAVTRLVAFDAEGTKVLESQPEAPNDFPVVEAGSQLWSVGVGSTCRGPQELLEIDAKSGESHVVTTLRTPVEPCLTEVNASQLTSLARSVFVLDPTGTTDQASVLYRISGLP
jgi:hypothetical protein